MDERMAWRNDLAAIAATERAGLSQSAALTDAHLVERVVAGDESAFEQIFTRYRRLVAKTATRFFVRPDEVEEMIQISFTKAYFELAKFRGDHEMSLPAWLSRITANACVDQLRSRKRRPQDLECELSDSEAEMLNRAADAGLADRALANRDLAEKLLAVLSPEDKALMQMLYAEELTVAESAEMLGWSQSKVKVRAWRARRTLRGAMKKYL
jgi:RNA polymerase sigma-70 factor (ECF subfamily)